MKLSFLRVAILAFALSPFAVACSADTSEEIPDGDDVTEDEANTARITAGEFKLYDEPRATPNPMCDVHTKLSLTADRGSRAKLEEAVGGFCEIAVFPNPREYRLRLIGQGCGSKTYAGSVRKDGKSYKIEITDHRTRTCRDLVPAKIIVKETVPGFPGAITMTKYSDDRSAASGEPITVDGTFVSVAGIGGESTGFGIESGSAYHELVLDENERGDFQDGRKARVKGTKIFLTGVESGNRPAIDVTEILVCPSINIFNCMPPVQPGNTACGADRSWIQANCPGVTYLD